MEQNHLQQMDGAKDSPRVGKVILRNSWVVIFGGCFRFCSGGGTTKIIFSIRI